MITGWYGFGSALQQLAEEDSQAIGALRDGLAAWPFWRNLVYNLQVGVASVSPEIAEQYSELCGDSDVRDSVWGAIKAEYERTLNGLTELCGADWQQRRPRLQGTIELRDQALGLLHQRQIRLLRDWRQARAADDQTSADALLVDLLQSVNSLTAVT